MSDVPRPLPLDLGAARATRISGLVAGLLLVIPLAAAGQELEKCDAPVGSLAVVEPQNATLQALRGYELESPTGVLRRMVQESGCFIVVERGVAFENMQQERELARAGELRGGSNVGGGQIVAADFILTPDVVFSDDNAGGIGGAVGGLVGGRLGAVAGGLKFKEAHTSILVSASRSGVQVAAAEGEARKTDFGLGGLAFLGGAGVALGGYTSTDEGKVILASFLDNLNNITTSVRGNPQLPALTPEQVRAIVTGDAAAGGGFSEGDVVGPKIDNVEVYDAPADGAAVVTRVARSDALVFLGAEENGFLQVQSSEGAGWIRKVLVEKR